MAMENKYRTSRCGLGKKLSVFLRGAERKDASGGSRRTRGVSMCHRIPGRIPAVDFAMRRRLHCGDQTETAELFSRDDDHFIAAVHGHVLRPLAANAPHQLAKARLGVLQPPAARPQVTCPALERVGGGGERQDQRKRRIVHGDAESAARLSYQRAARSFLASMSKATPPTSRATRMQRSAARSRRAPPRPRPWTVRSTAR
jgi:hypothetical protein